MSTNRKLSVLALALMATLPSFAQVDQSGTCSGAQTCTPSIKNAGDSTVNYPGDTTSSSAQNGVSAAANGVTISPLVTTKVQQDAAQNLTGDDSAKATGGNAIGNQSSNDNRSSVGNTSSNSGGNKTSSSSTGTNTLRDSGNASQGQGQQQGIAGSGNSTVRGGNTSGTVTGTQSLSNSGNSRATGGTSSQGQGQSSRNNLSTSAGNGAGASAGAGAGSGNRTSNTTNLDASDRSSSRDRTTVWANPVIHGQGAAALPSANIAIVPGVCGPRVMVVSRPVVGREAHMISDSTNFDHTTTDRVVALTDGNGLPVNPFEVRGGYLIGHQVTVMAAVIGTSTAASFSLGGFSSSGGGAQGGAAASGQLQQLVKSVEVVECVYGPVMPTAVYIPEPLREVPAKRIRR